MKAVMKEIGSEFWADTPAAADETPVWEKYPGDKRFYLSGRTALHAAIVDAMKEKPCKRAYLPEYCCDSMVEPFLREGLNVLFYPVKVQNGFASCIDPACACDIVLTMDYFGYRGQASVLPAGAVHIHDVTHSLLSQPAYKNADYYIGSLRKWDAVAGAGFACKTAGNFRALPAEKENTAYTALRYRGYALKARYIQENEGEKQAFLSLFGQAEELLDRDYANYAADAHSLEAAARLGAHRPARRDNAVYLTNALKNSRLMQPVWTQVGADDVPLFVPVLVKGNCRNELRRFLIENQVYCPVHWPVHNGCGGTIYNEELSLLCDQRYTIADMQRIAELIICFEERCNP